MSNFVVSISKHGYPDFEMRKYEWSMSKKFAYVCIPSLANRLVKSLPSVIPESLTSYKAKRTAFKALPNVSFRMLSTCFSDACPASIFLRF